tara:strand:+ start:4201 stop:4530 length:330 start_codon:yes stop_codon:yes gene_type:complete
MGTSITGLLFWMGLFVLTFVLGVLLIDSEYSMFGKCIVTVQSLVVCYFAAAIVVDYLYTKWVWKKTDIRLADPNMMVLAQLDNGKIIGPVRAGIMDYERVSEYRKVKGR